MGWFGRKSTPPEDPANSADRLRRAVRAHMPDADHDTVEVVTAVAGLLAAVAYSDRDFADAEAAMAHATLSRIDGLGPAGVEAVMQLLRETAADAATIHTYRFTRTLKDAMDQPAKLEILDLLVDLIAADGKITMAETNFVRQVATGLGLTQADYNASQSRHREKLTVLEGAGRR